MLRRHIVFFLVIVLSLSAFSCSDDDPVDTGGGGITEEEAEGIITETVIPSVVSPGEKYICIGLASPVPEGSIIAEYAPAGGGVSMGRTSGLSLEVGEESYFYYINLDPYAFYSHPVKYVLVEKSSGSFEVSDAEWWPVINGATPSQFIDTDPDSSFVIDSLGDIVMPTGTPSAITLPADLDPINVEGYICVQGITQSEALYLEGYRSYLAAHNFFSAYGNGLSRVVDLTENGAPNVLSVVDQLVAEGKDIITLYIIGHGNTNVVVLGGHRMYPSDFRSKFAEHPGVIFNFMLGSCHSGSFVDELETLSNVRVVMTASEADGNAYPDWDIKDGIDDYNPEDAGSEWTSSVFEAADWICSNSTRWSLIEDYAGTYGIPAICQLLREAHYGALGQNSEYDLFNNIELMARTYYETPQGYFSWEAPAAE